MLTIRDQQFAVFSQLAVKNFISWMTSHLRRFFPFEAGLLGDSELHFLIRSGISDAAQYGVTSKRDVCKFIDVSFVLGRDFPDRYAWARRILDGAYRPDVKMRLLIDAAVGRLGGY